MSAVYQGIPEISVNGVKGKFAGGWIYNYDLSIGYSEEPNKLNLSMVLEDNKSNFTVPQINLRNNTFTISFGDINFVGYLYSSRIEVNSSEKILHCTFVDKSIILDQVYVGLKDRFSFGSNATSHILIGREVKVEDPQPEEQQKVRCIDCNTLNEVVVPTNNKGDPTCNPPGEEEKAYDVQYTFEELLQEVTKFLPHSGFVTEPESWGSYTGTLREVLSSWGSDHGFSFFYDFKLGRLSFINLLGGISIPSVPSNINSLKVKSYSNEVTAEGSYTQGIGTFNSKAESEDGDSDAKLSTRVYNFTKEVYQQLSLVYDGPAWGLDAELGLLASADSSSRDNYCTALGMYQRVGWKSPFQGYMLNLASYKVRDFAEIIGDSNLSDLAGEPWAQIIYTEVNEGIKEYYMNVERVALDAYGKLYKIVGAVPPVNRTDVECVGSTFRKITTYEWYPPFNDQGRWMKDTGTATVGQAGNLWEKADTVYSLEGDTKNAFYQYFTEARGAIAGRVAIVFVGMSFFNVPGCCRANISEEALHNPNTVPWQHNCPLQCEGGTVDPCDAYLQCSSDAYTVQQGITNNSSHFAGNVVAPSTAPFVGWHKRNEEYTKVFPGNTTSEKTNFKNSGEIGDGRDTANTRYLLVDTSNGGEPSGGGGAGYQGVTNYEFIGLPEGISLNPSNGLSSLSINLSSNGLFSKVTFQSRPNPPAQEKTLQKVTPRKTLFT